MSLQTISHDFREGVSDNKGVGLVNPLRMAHVAFAALIFLRLCFLRHANFN